MNDMIKNNELITFENGELKLSINIDNRDKCAEMVKTSGFDIKDVAEKMEKIYLMGS